MSHRSAARSNLSKNKFTARSNKGNAYENYMAMRAQSQQIDQSQDAYSEKDSFDNDSQNSDPHGEIEQNGNIIKKEKKSKTHKRPQSCYNFKVDDKSSFSSQEDNKFDS